MLDFSLALRNIGRNRRRSAVTILAVAISCGGVSVFGGYASWLFKAVEEQTVSAYGHVQIYKKGYYEFGTGNPAAYAIPDYEKLKQLIEQDPVISPSLQLVTGQILFNGMVTCTRTQSASTFAGLGVFPSDDAKMSDWNPYGITPAKDLPQNARFFKGVPELADDDVAGASVGSGLAAVLRLNDNPSAKPTPAAAPPTQPSTPPAAPSTSGADVDLNFLTSQSGPKDPEPAGKTSLDLLVSPPTGGLPNATTINLRKVVPRASKELEDTLIKLHVKHASNLLFPEQQLHVTAVILLLKQTKDTDAVLARVRELIDTQKLDLEFKRWEEIRPFYKRMARMITLIFDFVFVLLVVMVAFLIYNTQSAGIMERLGEIGTLRAMGVTRIGVWQMLVAEGLLLGLIGGLAGVLLAIGADLGFKMVDITYIPPTVSYYAKLEVLVLRDPVVLLQAFLGATLCSAVSAALPARKAAHMEIVEALHHS